MLCSAPPPPTGATYRRRHDTGDNWKTYCLTFWRIRPQSRPPTGALPVDPTGEFCPPDYDSTKAGWGEYQNTPPPINWRLVV